MCVTSGHRHNGRRTGGKMEARGSPKQESTFVGRQQEMARLRSALDDAISGRGRVVMLAGEPGIGKTRTAQEVAALGEQKGAQVMWGWCYEHVGAPPYWPYVQPIRTYVEQTSAQQLSAEMGPGASDIAEIVPEIRNKISGLPASPSLAPEQARFRLFDSVATFFKNAGRTLPLILVLDDLHWADASSLLMLEFLAKEIGQSPVLILGTYRDVEVSGRHPLAQTLGTLVREQHYLKVSLGGLSLQEVGEFVQASAGVVLPVDAIEMVHSRTEGNPLFVSQVVGLVSPAQMVEDRSWAEVLPEGVRETIGRRLSRLSEPCNQVLRTASVIGREFDASLLQQLTTDLSADGVLDALDEALEARVVEPLPQGMSRHRFGHALFQQTLYEELTPVQRARIHARTGEALEALYGDFPGDYAAELAYHFAEASQVVGTEKLVKYALVAGERALETHAYEEALGYFRQGLLAKSLEPDGPATDSARAALLFGLGRSQAATSGHSVSKTREAIGNLKKAFEHYRHSDQPERALQVAEYPVRPQAGYQIGLKDLVGPAVEMAPPDSPEAARLYSIYGSVLGLEEIRYDEAQEAFSRALAIAQRSGDVSLEMRALANAANVHYFHARQQEALRTSLRAIELSDQLNDPRTELAARYIAVLALRVTGNLQDAARHASAMLNLAERIRDHFWLVLSYWVSEHVCLSMGDWHAARSFSELGLSVSPGAPTLLSTRVRLEYEVGQIDEGARFLERLLDVAKAAPNWPVFDHAAVANTIPVIASITGVLGRFDVAEKAAETVLLSPQALPMFSMIAQNGLALMAVMREDRAGCEKLYDRILSLEEYVSYPMVRGRLLGLLAQAKSHLDKAAAHFEDALAFCRKAGYRPELAWTCHDYADTLLQRQSSGDRTRATELLEEARAVSTDLGMAPLLQRVTTLQERVASLPERAPAYPDGLSQREVEVLRLVAAGKTDREIGEELIISIYTVSNHVRSILNKTGSANRTEAAAYAARRGLD